MEHQPYLLTMGSRAVRLRFDTPFAVLSDPNWFETRGSTIGTACRFSGYYNNPLYKRNIFNIFVESGLHKTTKKIKDVLSVVEYRDKTSMGSLQHSIFKNSKQMHSEENVIIFLNELLMSGNLPSQIIKIYTNFSPCWKCSQRLRSFIQEAKNRYGIYLGMDIIFPFLYRIRRPSCENESHPVSHGLPSQEDHRENLTGLKNLEEIGVDLRTFSKDDWLFLASLLDVPYIYEGTLRQKEDEALKADFQLLMKPVKHQGAEGSAGSAVESLVTRLRVSLTTEDVSAVEQSAHQNLLRDLQ